MVTGGGAELCEIVIALHTEVHFFGGGKGVKTFEGNIPPYPAPYATLSIEFCTNFRPYSRSVSNSGVLFALGFTAAEEEEEELHGSQWVQTTQSRSTGSRWPTDRNDNPAVGRSAAADEYNVCQSLY